MGGGTGTGAAPIIAKVARDMDILTVGICTSPFGFEGKKKSLQALQGINELKEHCDTVLVILNDRLRDIYGNLSIREAFAQADNVLTMAAKSIAEIITVTSHVNVDFEDVKTVMKASGAAVMGSAITSGENRARRAAEEALLSPLLDSRDILGAKKILLSITFGEQGELTMDELNEITEYIQERAGNDGDVIWGYGLNPALGDQLCVTVIATGFEETEVREEKRKVYNLETDKHVSVPEIPQVEKPVVKSSGFTFEKPLAPEVKSEPMFEQKTIFDLDTSKEITPEKKQPEINWIVEKKNTDEMQDKSLEDEKKRLLTEQSKERIRKLKGLSSNTSMTPEEFKEKLEVPAYMRKNVNLQDHPHSSERNISRFNLNDDNEILGNNKFLHDNVD
jgi:cell division protein FtsZ